MLQVSSIHIRLLLMIVPLMMLSLGTLGGLSYYFANQYLTRSVDETAIAIGSDYSNQIRAIINERVIEMEDLASNQLFRGNSDDAQVVKLLHDTHQRTGDFDNINALFPDGKGFRFDGSTTNVADRDYLKKAVSTKKTYISEPMLTRGTGKLGIIIAVPVLDNDKLTRVITGNVSLQRVADLLQEVKFKETGYAAMIDNSGMVIAHAKRPELNGKFNITEKKIDPELKASIAEIDGRFLKLFEEAKTGKRVIGLYTDLDGVRHVGILAPLRLPGGQQWIMIVSAPEEEVARETAILGRTMLIVSLVSIFLASVGVIVLSKRFAAPIQRIRDECMLLAQGDLREREVKILSQDEIGQLAQGFDTMRSTLRALVTRVQSQAKQVAAASKELTEGAHQSADAANQVAGSISEIAKGTEKQADSATHISLVAEQMSASTEQISATAHKVAEIAKSTSQEAEQGRVAVEQAIDQMNQIGQGSEAVQIAIAELSTGSREISEIVTLISTIAGQTNLLALNAAIEAARAGEHGRGFAVVAEEVRKLAEESNQAAQQIAVLIQKNLVNMDQAVAATQAGTEGVQAGISVVNSAGETFEKIVGSIKQLSEQIKGISDSIDHMAVGSHTLVSAIHEIDKVSKENAAEAQTVSAATEEQSASMQEIASSSQSLSTLAGDLQEAVAKFRV